VTGSLKIKLLNNKSSILTLSFSKIELVKNSSSPFLALIDSIRQKIITSFQTVLPKDSSALLLGILFGIKENFSETGMSDYFLSQISPTLAIISIGANNLYGHPSKSALDLLNFHNIKNLRTDKNGAIEIISDGQSFKIIN
jgi:hypothetical protein